MARPCPGMHAYGPGRKVRKERIMSLRNLTLLLAATFLPAGGWVLAEGDKPEAPGGKSPAKPEAAAPAKPAPKPAASAEDIAGWIKALDDEEFKVREAATQSLIEAGTGAIAPVADVAKGKSPEVTSRSIAVLKVLAKSEDEKAKSAALAALDKLAEDKEHESGQQARDALTELRPPVRGRHIHGPGGVAVGNVQVVGGQQMAVFTIQMGGKRTVAATENGKRVDITEDNNGITVTVTEKAKDGGKPKVTVYKASGEKELKTKHPDAHKLYEKYAGNNQGNVVIQGGQLNLVPAPARAAIAARPRLNLRQATKLIDEARAELDAAVKALKAAKDGKPTAEEIAKLLDQIEAANKKLEEARKNMGR